MLESLACPFCGALLERERGVGRIEDDELCSGILYCSCAAYPVVDGIPFMRTGALTDRLLELVGHDDAVARATALTGGTDSEAVAAVATLTESGNLTFREIAGQLIHEAEATYLFHRFSDPTYVASSAALDVALAGIGDCTMSRALDVGGGAGHLTRRIAATGADVVLVDISFVKLWLARRFLAPTSTPVCCDANAPLPVAKHRFDLVFSSDAFHYVWNRRLLASEMVRALAPTGLLLLTHLHNSLVDNLSAGMPLTPTDYQRLFADVPTRFIPEEAAFGAALEGRPADLRALHSPHEIQESAALIVVGGALTTADNGAPPPASGDTLQVNPLYEPHGKTDDWVLRFPSDYYAEEYQAARRYLPDVVKLSDELRTRARAGADDPDIQELRRRRVLLPLPQAYA